MSAIPPKPKGRDAIAVWEMQQRQGSARYQRGLRRQIDVNADEEAELVARRQAERNAAMTKRNQKKTREAKARADAQAAVDAAAAVAAAPRDARARRRAQRIQASMPPVAPSVPSTLLSGPAVQPARVKPPVHPATVQPSVPSLFGGPTFQPTAVQPLFQPAAVQPVLGPTPTGPLFDRAGLPIMEGLIRTANDGESDAFNPFQGMAHPHFGRAGVDSTRSTMRGVNKSWKDWLDKFHTPKVIYVQYTEIDVENLRKLANPEHTEFRSNIEVVVFYMPYCNKDGHIHTRKEITGLDVDPRLPPRPSVYEEVIAKVLPLLQPTLKSVWVVGCGNIIKGARLTDPRRPLTFEPVGPSIHPEYYQQINDQGWEQTNGAHWTQTLQVKTLPTLPNGNDDILDHWREGFLRSWIIRMKTDQPYLPRKLCVALENLHTEDPPPFTHWQWLLLSQFHDGLPGPRNTKRWDCFVESWTPKPWFVSRHNNRIVKKVCNVDHNTRVLNFFKRGARRGRQEFSLEGRHDARLCLRTINDSLPRGVNAWRRTGPARPAQMRLPFTKLTLKNVRAAARDLGLLVDELNRDALQEVVLSDIVIHHGEYFAYTEMLELLCQFPNLTKLYVGNLRYARVRPDVRAALSGTPFSLPQQWASDRRAMRRLVGVVDGRRRARGLPRLIGLVGHAPEFRSILLSAPEQIWGIGSEHVWDVPVHPGPPGPQGTQGPPGPPGLLPLPPLPVPHLLLPAPAPAPALAPGPPPPS